MKNSYIRNRQPQKVRVMTRQTRYVYGILYHSCMSRLETTKLIILDTYQILQYIHVPRPPIHQDVRRLYRHKLL